jgi:putative ABC transport system permease protein
MHQNTQQKVNKEIDSKRSGYKASWPWVMAWRDARKNGGKLFLFIASITLGIGAMVGINSFRENLLGEINDQAKELLGADVEVKSQQPLTDSLYAEFNTLAPENSKELYFASMVYFPTTNGTRLVQVRALEGDFPYYGDIETEPLNAAKDFKTGRFALVDEKMMMQYNVEVGDQLKIGQQEFEILGKLQKMPGQTGIGAAAAPVVYIPYQYAFDTELIQKGSRINYLNYFKFDSQPDTLGWSKLLKKADALGYRSDDVDERKRETDQSFGDLTNFLSLIAFIALLLGCIGISSSIYVYTKEKTAIIATLRCLGMKAHQATYIFLIQVAFFGLIGSIIGCILGVGLHLYLPLLLQDFLPVTIDSAISWSSISMGLTIGVVTSVLFALIPLLALRTISPLQAIRADFENGSIKLDFLQIAVALFTICFLLLVVYLQIGDWKDAVVYTGSLLASIVILYLIAIGLTRLIKRFAPEQLPYVMRQGLSNLYRPQNQTRLLIITLGLGTAFIATLIFVENMLIERVSISGADDRPNTVLFDIQTNQKEGLIALTKDFDLPIMQEVPVVTMRLLEINGISKNEAESDTTIKIKDWFYTREYRVTYRDSLISSEKITDGKWAGIKSTQSDSIFVSIAGDYAKQMDVKIGDALLFNIQGAVVKTYVGSFREIDWRRVQTNFLVVFPTGVLEKAPQFHVVITKTSSPQRAANYQQAVVKNFPNVSVIDLELILKTLDEILGKVAFVIQFMAFISIATGLIMLISSIMLSRFQRVKENVLLRTLGATNSQLWKIIASEYFFLSLLASLLGLLLAVIFAFLLGKFVFEFVFIPSAIQSLKIVAGICAITITIGLLNNRNILNQSPMESIRKES